LEENELNLLKESSRMLESDIIQLWESFKKENYGQEINSQNQLKNIFSLPSFSSQKTWIELILEKTDISGKNNLFQTRNLSFKENCQKDSKLQDYVIEIFWNALDSDQSSSISFTELIIGLNFLIESDKQKKAQFQFEMMDLDKNGFLDRKELERLAKFRSHAMRAHYEISFESLREDLLKSGIEESKQNEIRDSVVKELYFSKEIVEISVNLCFKYADLNKDGKVSKEEYIRWATDEQLLSEYIDNFENTISSIIKNLQSESQRILENSIFQILGG